MEQNIDFRGRNSHQDMFQKVLLTISLPGFNHKYKTNLGENAFFGCASVSVGTKASIISTPKYLLKYHPNRKRYMRILLF